MGYSKSNNNLLGRTLSLSRNFILLIPKFEKNETNKILIRQALRSITSIGANYREACEAESSKDFVHKIRLSKKEARESEYWLLLLSDGNKKLANEVNTIIDECTQLVKIFSTIVSKFK